VAGKFPAGGMKNSDTCEKSPLKISGMLKVRAMGTPKDLDKFRDFLLSQDAYSVRSMSDQFTCQGTNQYYRMYAEMEERGC
jgi:hypothetical protein